MNDAWCTSGGSARCIPPVGVGILGAGAANVATAHQLPASMASERVQVVALCDRLQGVETYADDVGVRAYTDFGSMLSDPDVEMVQIATPDWLHVEHAELALAAGKHVLLQKPPCVTRAGLDRLRQAARHAEGKLKILLNNRHRREIRTLKRAVSDGAIGDLVHVRIAYRGHRFPIADPDSPYLADRLGGVWLHNGLHWLDEACFYADALPTRVQTMNARNPVGPANVLGEGPNYWCGMFRFGARASFTLEYNTMLTGEGMPGGMQRVLIGTEGELRQDYGCSTIWWFRRECESGTALPVCDHHLTPEADVTRSFQLAIDDFAAEIRGAPSRPPSLEDALVCMDYLIRSRGSSSAVCGSEREAARV